MTLTSQYKNLAIIPARGGSKGLSRKNIKMLNQKPMLAYTIEAAIQSGCFNKVIVSTDDSEISGIAAEYGAEVPFLRPLHLANDTAKIVDVLLHAIDFFEMRQDYFDYVTLLQPTSPLRCAADIVGAMKLCKEKQANSIISVCEASHSPLWMNTLPEDNNLENFLNKDILNKRRQDLPVYYRLNGAIYILNVEFLKASESFYSDKSYAYVMPPDRSIDVDHILDFQLCETVLTNE